MQTSSPQKTVLPELAALLSLPWVDGEGGFSLSPDGRQIAFAWNPGGRWEIYLVPTSPETSAETLPARLPFDYAKIPELAHLSTPPACLAPRFTPDGQALLFAADPNGSENYQIIYYPLDPMAAPRRLALAQSPLFELLPPRFDRQADVDPTVIRPQLLFLSDRLGQLSVFAMPLEGGEERLIFSSPQPAVRCRAAPDGRWLAVECEGPGQEQTIFILPLTDGTPATPHRSWIGRHPAWSPDSRRLVFSAINGDWQQLAVYDLESETLEWLTEGRGDKDLPFWSPDGQQLAYRQSEGPQSWIVVASPGKSERRFQAAPGVHESLRFAPDGQRIYFVFSNPRLPDGLWQLELSSGRISPLVLPPSYSASNPPARGDARPLTAPSVTRSLSRRRAGRKRQASPAGIMPQEITYPSLDGQTVPALLYLPDQPVSNPPPAVINIHGGPTWLFSFLWYPFMSFLAAKGVIVLAPNYRGSTGYGRPWQLANRFDLGGGDADDCAAGALFLAQSGLADPHRIAVTGRSHGGYLTMVCLTRFPELWAAGSAEVPFLNWFTSHANSRPDLQFWDRQNFGDPEKDQELWHERSPYFFLDRIQAPVQLIGGANDPRCPASEAIQAAEALRRLGKEVELLLYPDEGHTFLKTENLIDAECRRADFLLRHLLETRL